MRVSAQVPVATDASSEVLRLQNIVSQLQVQLAKSEGGASVAMPENFVCQTVEEIIEWMDARQSDMRVAVEVGNASEVSRLAAMLAEGASQLKSWTLSTHQWQPMWWVEGVDLVCGACQIRLERGSSWRGVAPRASIVASSPEETGCSVRDFVR